MKTQNAEIKNEIALNQETIALAKYEK